MRTLVARSVGRLLAVAIGVIMLVRRPRPIHARGVMLEGQITRTAVRPRSGILWIDDGDADPIAVVARLSRSVGLPSALPDVIGLAIRFRHDTGVADIELASSGLGVPFRFLLRPHWSPSRARLCTLLPYRGRYGPVLLCARTVSPDDLPPGGVALDVALEQPWRLQLLYAGATGKWHPFADITLRRPTHPLPTDLRFDAVARLLPGADVYEWVRAVREPSYRLAQGESQATGSGYDRGKALA